MDIENIKDHIPHKFYSPTDLNYQDVFYFAFGSLIPILDKLSYELGRERFLTALKDIAYEAGVQSGRQSALQAPDRDLRTFLAWAREPNHFWQHVVTLELVEDTPQICEIKTTECLWAKTFREIGCPELGYILYCEPDYAACQGFNPEITLTRTKTLMEGHDCCNHRYEWKK